LTIVKQPLGGVEAGEVVFEDLDDPPLLIEWGHRKFLSHQRLRLDRGDCGAGLAAASKQFLLETAKSPGDPTRIEVQTGHECLHVLVKGHLEGHNGDRKRPLQDSGSNYQRD